MSRGHDHSIHPSIHIHSRLRCCVPFNGVGSTRLCRTPALQASLSDGSKPARPHLSTSVFTHSDHVLSGLPFFLMLGSRKFVIDLTQDVTCCTWPYGLSRQQQRSDVKSLMPSFSSREAEGVFDHYVAMVHKSYTVLVANDIAFFI